MMLRAYAVMDSGSRWALVMMRLSVKTPSLSQFLPLPFGLHSFSLLFISDNMVAKALTIGLVPGVSSWIDDWDWIVSS